MIIFGASCVSLREGEVQIRRSISQGFERSCRCVSIKYVNLRVERDLGWRSQTLKAWMIIVGAVS